jgi:histidine triad (HIT) family protein
MSKTIFQKIADKEIPADIVFEDDKVIAFRDIAPQAPIHLLIVPRKPLETLNQADESDALLLGHMMLVAKQLAERLQISQDGYRIVMNCNQHGGQTVFHIHLHLLGGKQLQSHFA